MADIAEAADVLGEERKLLETLEHAGGISEVTRSHLRLFRRGLVPHSVRSITLTQLVKRNR